MDFLRTQFDKIMLFALILLFWIPMLFGHGVADFGQRIVDTVIGALIGIITGGALHTLTGGAKKPEQP